MATIKKIIYIIITLFIFFVPVLAQEAPTLEIIYIANEGFMLSSGTKKVLIDALQKNRWDYHSTPEDVINKMNNAQPPFDNIDLLLVSRDNFINALGCGVQLVYGAVDLRSLLVE